MAFNRLSLEQKLLTKAQWVNGCLVWTGQTDKKGYGRLRLDGRRQRSHRLMYELHHGKIPDGVLVRHSCDNPPCINIAHLSLGTQVDNMRDMHSRGRADPPKGEDHPHNKLTEAQVREIRLRHQSRSRTNGGGALAKEFGISKATVQDIVARKIWKHIA